MPTRAYMETVKSLPNHDLVILIKSMLLLELIQADISQAKQTLI